MKTFMFDVPTVATLYVKAASEAKARKRAKELLDMRDAVSELYLDDDGARLAFCVDAEPRIALIGVHKEPS